MAPMLEVTLSKFHSRVSCGKTRMMRPPSDEKSLTISLAVSTQYINITDGHTYGHRTTAKTALCTASRGKKSTTLMRQRTAHFGNFKRIVSQPIKRLWRIFKRRYQSLVMLSGADEYLKTKSFPRSTDVTSA